MRTKGGEKPTARTSVFEDKGLASALHPSQGSLKGRSSAQALQAPGAGTVDTISEQKSHDSSKSEL